MTIHCGGLGCQNRSLNQFQGKPIFNSYVNYFFAHYVQMSMTKQGFMLGIFQVMTQKHNRHLSFSLYISMLAVTDTVVLIVGELAFLINSILKDGE